MGGINATEDEKRQLVMKGYSDPVILPGADGPPKITYHNPTTGQEFKNLPADSYNLLHYIARGFQIGPPSDELRAKYEASEKVEVANTIVGTELPPELQSANLNNQGLMEEVAELKEMVKMLVIAQMGETKTPEASVPKSKAKRKKSKNKKKDVIIEEEEEIDAPYNTQLGLII